MDDLKLADPSDFAAALAFALRFHGRKRVRMADEIMAEIVAKRLVEHLQRAGFVVMKRPAIGGGGRLGRGVCRPGLGCVAVVKSRPRSRTREQSS